LNVELTDSLPSVTCSVTALLVFAVSVPLMSPVLAFSVSAAGSLLKSHGWNVVPGGSTTCAKPGTGPGECGAGIPAGTKLTFNVIYSNQPVREYRDAVGIDERISYLAWLFQQNRGVFKSPWTKQETWTLSVAHTEDDASRYIANFEEFASAVTS